MGLVENFFFFNYSQTKFNEAFTVESMVSFHVGYEVSKNTCVFLKIKTGLLKSAVLKVSVSYLGTHSCDRKGKDDRPCDQCS